MNATRNVTRAILVTGAGSGIGAAACRQLAAPGVGLLVHTRANQAGAEAVAQACRDKGAEVVVKLGDLSNIGTGAALIHSCVESFGRLDVLISNAGQADRRLPGGQLDRAGLSEVHGQVAGAFLDLANAALPHLQISRQGRIVGVSAFNAHLFRPDITLFPASASAKASLEVLARSLAIQLAPYQVTVNCVAPGFIRKDAETHTALTPEQWRTLEAKLPLGRLGTPDEVAAVIAFLAGPDAGYITGQVIHVNGGLL